MHCITIPHCPPVRTLVTVARDVVKNCLRPAPGRRTPHKAPVHARMRRYTLCSPRLCAALRRVLPTYGLMQTTTPDGTWFRIDSLTIRLTESVVSLYAGTKTAVPLGLLTLIAAGNPVLPDDSPVVPENGERIKQYLDYLTDTLHLPSTAAIAFLVIIPEPSGTSLSSLASALPNPAGFRADCQILKTYRLISITGDQITLSPKGTRIAHLLIRRA